MKLRTALLTAATLALGTQNAQAQEHQLLIRAGWLRGELSKTVNLSALGVGKQLVGVGGSGFGGEIRYRAPVGPLFAETDITIRSYRTYNKIPTRKGERKLTDLAGDVRVRLYGPALFAGLRPLASVSTAGFVNPEMYVTSKKQAGLGGGDSWDSRVHLGLATDPTKTLHVRVAYSRSYVTDETLRQGIAGAIGIQVTEPKPNKPGKRIALDVAVEGTYQASKTVWGKQNNSTLEGHFDLFLPGGPGVGVFYERNFGTSWVAQPNTGGMNPQRSFGGVRASYGFLIK